MSGNHPGGSIPIPSASLCVDAPGRPDRAKDLVHTVAATRTSRKTQIKVPSIVESSEQRDGHDWNKGAPLSSARRQAAGWHPTNVEKWEKKRQL